jgi:hypothetical protein
MISASNSISHMSPTNSAASSSDTWLTSLKMFDSCTHTRHKITRMYDLFAAREAKSCIHTRALAHRSGSSCCICMCCSAQNNLLVQRFPCANESVTSKILWPFSTKRARNLLCVNEQIQTPIYARKSKIRWNGEKRGFKHTRNCSAFDCLFKEGITVVV